MKIPFKKTRKLRSSDCRAIKLTGEEKENDRKRARIGQLVREKRKIEGKDIEEIIYRRKKYAIFQRRFSLC